MPDRKHNIEAMRQDYYARIAKHDMAPLWTVMSTLIPDEPVTRCTAGDLALSTTSNRWSWSRAA